MTRLWLDPGAGLCGGVRRALRGARSALRSQQAGGGARVVVYGELVHNPDICAQLRREGIAVEQRLEGFRPADVVIVRTHGIPPQEEQTLRARGVTLTDYTCPRVKKVQRLITARRAEGYRIVIVGHASHPEVRGHLGYAGPGALVLAGPEEIDPQAGGGSPGGGSPGGKVAVFAQTTITPELFASVVRRLQGQGLEPRVESTLCPFVLRRQEWIARYSRLAAASLLVGGANSSNTRRLYEIAAAAGPAFRVEGPADLDVKALLRYPTVAVTAGASTPEQSIRAVVELLVTAGATLTRPDPQRRPAP
jgi:(E)-4-hydroxy-3-methyl-but-2-enyl pyrophosphate reductase